MAEIIPVYQVVDPGLNYLHTKNYNLAIRLLPDGFSFTVFDTSKDMCIALIEFAYPYSLSKTSGFGSETHIEWLEEVLQQQILLKEGFNKVSVLLGGIVYTLMPPPLFDPDHAGKYLGFNYPLNEEALVKYDEIKSPEAFLIYAISKSLHNWIQSHYPDAGIFHICSSLIRNFHLQFRGGSPVTRIMANIQANTLDILIFKGADFIFCNSFNYISHTDLLYYLLFVMEQLKINADEAPLFLSGAIEEESELFRLISAYVRYVDFIPETTNCRINPAIHAERRHHYFDLLNVSLCG